MSHVGEEVRRLRQERGWPQPRLSVEAEIAVSAISEIENGRRNPNAGTLAKLARAFGVEIPDLFPKAPHPLRLPLEEAVRLPLDIGSIETEVLKTRKPESRKELEDAIREAGARELLARYEPEDLYELKDTLREERRRIHERPRTREGIEGEDPLGALIDLMWAIEAVERALELQAGLQPTAASEEESE